MYYHTGCASGNEIPHSSEPLAGVQVEERLRVGTSLMVSPGQLFSQVRPRVSTR